MTFGPTNLLLTKYPRGNRIIILNKKSAGGIALAALFALSVGASSIAGEFSYDTKALPGVKPWTSRELNDASENFQFAIIGDRSGGHNVEGTFELAMGQLNLLQPEFVINVGDMIEGYSDDPAELNAEWDEVDAMLAEFIEDEAVVAGLSRPLEFDAAQIAFIEDALARNSDAR